MTATPPEDWDDPQPQDVTVPAGQTANLQFVAPAEGQGQGVQVVVQWWYDHHFWYPAGSHCAGLGGPNTVASRGEILLLDPNGFVGNIEDCRITEDAGHEVPEVFDPGEFAATVTDAQHYPQLPPGLPIRCLPFTTLWLHNGPHTVRVQYRTGGEPPTSAQAQLTIDIRNPVIVPVYDAQHPALLQWSPDDPNGQTRTKKRFHYRILDAAIEPVSVDFAVYDLYRSAPTDDAQGPDWTVALEHEIWNAWTTGDLTNPLDGEGEWDASIPDPFGGPAVRPPAGLYAWDARVGVDETSGWGIDCISSTGALLWPATLGPAGQQHRARSLGLSSDGANWLFAIDYGLQSYQIDNDGTGRSDDDWVELGLGLGFVTVYDPDFSPQAYNLDDLTCRLHGAPDGRLGPQSHHEVVVPVPVTAMAKQGKYTFAVSPTLDVHADGHRGHAYRAPVAVGQTWCQIDLDVDSDNDDGCNAPERSAFEDVAEDVDGCPGKFVRCNTDDDDADGVVDAADGFNADGVAGTPDDVNAAEQFVPLVLSIPARTDPTAAVITLSYPASDPSARPLPGSGALRLWTKPGSAPRDARSVVEGGDYVPPGALAPAALGFAAGEVMLWIEAVTPGGGPGPRVACQLDPDGPTGPESAVEYHDAVRLSTFVVDVVVDDLPEEAATPPNEEAPGALVRVNADDDDGDGQVDGAQPGPVAAEDELVPVRVNCLVQSGVAGLARLSVAQGSDHVALWARPDRSDPVSLPAEWPVQGGAVEAVLWMEGRAPSDTVRDVELQLTYVPAGGGDLVGDRALVTVWDCDLDADTDNSGRHDAPDRTLAEDSTEDLAGDDSRPGKVMLVEDWDLNLDLIPDVVNGFGLQDGEGGCDGLEFVPVVLEYRGPTDAAVRLKLDYDASDPRQIVLNAVDPYALPPGHLRLWTKDGCDARDPRDVAEGGDYVAPGSYTPAELGFTEAGVVVLYAEAIRPSATTADIAITVRADPLGTGWWKPGDRVRVTATQFELLGRPYGGGDPLHYVHFVCTDPEDLLDPEDEADQAALLLSRGGHLVYELLVHDPRQNGPGAVLIAGQALALTRRDGVLATPPFVTFHPEAIGDPAVYLYQALLLPDDGVDVVYDTAAPSGPLRAQGEQKKPRAKRVRTVPTTDDEKTICGVVADVVEKMKAAEWKPEQSGYQPNDSGAFGKEVHRRVANVLRGKDGYLDSVVVEVGTGRIVSIGDPSVPGSVNAVQIDLLHTESGYHPSVGDILDKGKIRATWDIKTSLYGGMDPDQADRLVQATGVARVKCTSRTQWRYTRQNGWSKNNQYTEATAVLSMIGLAAAAYAMFDYSDFADEWQTLSSALDQMIADIRGGNPEQAPETYLAEVVPAANAYLRPFIAVENVDNLVFLKTMYDALRKSLGVGD